MSWPAFEPAFYLVAVIAILLTGISKGGFGSGIGGIAAPLRFGVSFGSRRLCYRP